MKSLNPKGVMSSEGSERKAVPHPPPLPWEKEAERGSPCSVPKPHAGPCHRAAGMGHGYGPLESSAAGHTVEEVPGAQALESSPEKPCSDTFLREGGHDAQVCSLRTNLKRAEEAQEMPHS